MNPTSRPLRAPLAFTLMGGFGAYLAREALLGPGWQSLDMLWGVLLLALGFSTVAFPAPGFVFDVPRWLGPLLLAGAVVLAVATFGMGPPAGAVVGVAFGIAFLGLWVSR